MTTALLDEQMQGKIEKLVASGHYERYLFLSAWPQAFSFEACDNLCFAGAQPGEPQILQVGLSELWLASAFSEGGVVRAWPATGGDESTCRLTC